MTIHLQMMIQNNKMKLYKKLSQDVFQYIMRLYFRGYVLPKIAWASTMYAIRRLK